MSPKATPLSVEQEAALAEQEAREAAQRAAQAQERARQAAAAREQRRQQRLDEYRRQRLDDYDEEALEAEVRAAREQLRQAVMADPICTAYVRLAVASGQKYMHATEAKGYAQQIGDDRQHSIIAHAGTTDGRYLPDEVGAEINREIGVILGEERDALQAALEQHMTGGEA